MSLTTNAETLDFEDFDAARETLSFTNLRSVERPSHSEVSKRPGHWMTLLEQGNASVIPLRLFFVRINQETVLWSWEVGLNTRIAGLYENIHSFSQESDQIPITLIDIHNRSSKKHTHTSLVTSETM